MRLNLNTARLQLFAPPLFVLLHAFGWWEVAVVPATGAHGLVHVAVLVETRVPPSTCSG